jgi:redox-sensitive bicupin YhaK (pirin superfamily)
MLQIRKSEERGLADHGWLNSRHTFSFGHYYDPKHTGFGPLLVINEDKVTPAQGFGTHGHRDMEIISYVLEGELAHKDSMGNGSVLRYGDVQRMSAGTGVRHSEFNGSPTDTAHFLQIWIIPDAPGGAPGYEEKRFDDAEKRGRLRVIASPHGRDGAVKIGADTEIYAGLVDGDERVEFDVPAGRRVYVHVARGAVSVNGEALDAGDAAKLVDVPKVTLERGAAAEVLLFDLA